MSVDGPFLVYPSVMAPPFANIKPHPRSGDSLLAALHTQAHAAWSRLHHQRRHRKHPRRSSTSNTINPIAQWAQQLLAGYPSVLSFAREQLTAAKTLARQAEAAWAAVVDRVSWWWLLLGSGSARLGCGFGGSGGGNGEGVLVTLAELEMEWAGIALCPVRCVFVGVCCGWGWVGGASIIVAH